MKSSPRDWRMSALLFPLARAALDGACSSNGASDSPPSRRRSRDVRSVVAFRAPSPHRGARPVAR